VEFVTLAEKADAAAHRLYERLRSPLLTDLSIDWGGLPVKDVYPQRLPDLFSGRPLVLAGRYSAPANGTIRLRAKRAGEDFVREIPVSFTSNSSRHDTLPGFWARRKIDDLMSQDWAGMQRGGMKPEMQNEITQLGLDYRLVTQFTSFVAVEERVVTKGGVPQRVEVPVEMPERVSYEGVFGDEEVRALAVSSPNVMSRMVGRVASAAGGVAGGFYRAKSAPAPPPSLPTQAEVETTAPTSADRKISKDRALLESKLHPALLEAFDCWKSSKNCKSVTQGKVEVQIWLVAASREALDQLKSLGFEPAHAAGKTVTGGIPVEKLEGVVKMTQVKFVSLVRK
jgi:Ca-activated chloride channel family protein